MWASLRLRDPWSVPNTPMTPPPLGNTDLPLRLINVWRGSFLPSFFFFPSLSKKLKMESKSQRSETKKRDRNGENSGRKKKKTSTQASTLAAVAAVGRHTLPGLAWRKAPLFRSEVSRGEARPPPPPDPGQRRSLLGPRTGPSCFSVPPVLLPVLLPASATAQQTGKGCSLASALPKHQGSHMWGKAGLLRWAPGCP